MQLFHEINITIHLDLVKTTLNQAVFLVVRMAASNHNPPIPPVSLSPIPHLHPSSPLSLSPSFLTSLQIFPRRLTISSTAPPQPRRAFSSARSPHRAPPPSRRFCAELRRHRRC